MVDGLTCIHRFRVLRDSRLGYRARSLDSHLRLPSDPWSQTLSGIPRWLIWPFNPFAALLRYPTFYGRHTTMRIQRLLLGSILFWLVFAPITGLALDVSTIDQPVKFEAKIVGVVDGDTVAALVLGKEVKIRLNGIDAPESHQDFGNKSKQFLAELVFQKNVFLLVYGKDQYRRWIADVILPSGENVNERSVREGFSWWYEKYAPDNLRLQSAQQEAKENKSGLWAQENAVPPWEFRRPSPKKDLSQNRFAVPPPSPEEQASASRSYESQISSRNRSTGTSLETVYSTSTGSKYHRAGCRYLAKSQIPLSVSGAHSRGLTPCSVCNPPTSPSEELSGGQVTPSLVDVNPTYGITNGLPSPRSPSYSPSSAPPAGYSGLAPSASQQDHSYSQSRPNLDGYGAASKSTGQPKTKWVEGYHRKDGTYVRGHYRSR